jgi:two-component system chemotaxis response regulator CheB
MENGHIELSSGPKENGHRPAIDSMFRAAARHYGERAIGVILTGMLDDGVAGLMSIKMRGGAAIVQDPDDAVFSAMPESAIRRVDVDCVAPLASMAKVIEHFVTGPDEEERLKMNGETKENISEEMSLGDVVTTPVHSPEEVPGELTMLTCPECHGSLWQLQEGGHMRFRCHVGHAYTEESFYSEKTDEIEAALWSALRALQEHAHLLGNMAAGAKRRGHSYSGKRFEDSQAETERRAEVIRRVLLNGKGLALDAYEEGA